MRVLNKFLGARAFEEYHEWLASHPEVAAEVSCLEYARRDGELALVVSGHGEPEPATTTAPLSPANTGFDLFEHGHFFEDRGKSYSGGV